MSTGAPWMRAGSSGSSILVRHTKTFLEGGIWKLLLPDVHRNRDGSTAGAGQGMEGDGGTKPPVTVSGGVTLYHERQGVACVSGGASHKKVSRNFNWIWYLGAAVWFLNAALAMYHGKLRLGLTNALISAVFLAAGVFFGKQAKRPTGRGNGRGPLE